MVNESLLDMVEERLHQRLEYGDMRAIEFFLDRKGKTRGYQQEININLPPVSFQVNFGGNPGLQNTIELPITPSEEVDTIEDGITAQTKLIEQSTDVNGVQLNEIIQSKETQLIENKQSNKSRVKKKTQSNKSDTLDNQL